MYHKEKGAEEQIFCHGASYVLPASLYFLIFLI